MREWAKALNVDDSKLPMMSDGDGIWCARLGELRVVHVLRLFIDVHVQNTCFCT